MGEAAASFEILPIDDDEIEDDETIILTLVIESGGRLAEGGSIQQPSLVIIDKPRLYGR